MSTTWPPRQIPFLPEELKIAASEGNLAIFIGAGVSRLVGCPSWGEFADSALKQLADKDIINFSDIQQLSHLDAKKRLSIASQIANTEGFQLDYQKLIEPQVPTNSQIYSYLNRIGCIYITTNYDLYLDYPTYSYTLPDSSSFVPQSGKKLKELICRPDQFKRLALRTPGNIVHLHGSIKERESMIITTVDYLEHYRNEYVVNFLEELFGHYTVLFIGYGLEEAEILEHVLRKGKLNIDKTLRRRFMLQGFYSHQQRTFEHLHNYYSRTFGVYICHFSLDYLNHAQLEKIVDDWSQNLKVGEPLLADDLKAILEAADE
ncbi:MAG TPA: SIR2 family protein [Smithellaceae bacterium]|nr:SIR2 family protein [Smithellaceae bacterium]HPL48459.1 SIR2 family protein [Smithella sp.]